MLAMILSLPPQRTQRSISMPNTRFKGEPTRAGRPVRVAFQALQPGRNGLQREQLLPGLGAHGDPVGDGVPDQVIHLAGLCPGAQPGVLEVALDQPTAFQNLADACGDLLDQLLQVVGVGGCHMAERWRVRTIWQIHASREQHVEVHVQVQRRTEALYQCHRSHSTGGARESGLVDEMAGNRWADAVGTRLGDRRDATRAAPDMLGVLLGASTAEALRRAASSAQAITLLLASPEFMRR